MANVLTALQPSGVLHIGNYFGAIEPMVKLQANNDLRLFTVDYHAITVEQDPEELRKNILFSVATYLAAGIDPKKTMIFQQSRVSEHTELAWVLNCVAHMGELDRMTQFKEKAEKQKSVSVGLFSYPVLMAADILLYDTEFVPVGEDQKQHLEFTRDLAERFNNRFGETFTVPDVQIRETGARIMGLDDPTKKMSKSASSAKNYISLTDDDETIRKKIKGAVTDSEAKVAYDEKRPGVANLMTIYSLVTGKSMEQIETDYATTKGYGDFKADVGETLVLFLKPLRAAIETHLKNPDVLKKILDDGAERAKKIAAGKMIEVRKKIGVTL